MCKFVDHINSKSILIFQPVSKYELCNSTELQRPPYRLDCFCGSMYVTFRVRNGIPASAFRILRAMLCKGLFAYNVDVLPWSFPSPSYLHTHTHPYMYLHTCGVVLREQPIGTVPIHGYDCDVCRVYTNASFQRVCVRAYYLDIVTSDTKVGVDSGVWPWFSVYDSDA